MNGKGRPKNTAGSEIGVRSRALYSCALRNERLLEDAKEGEAQKTLQTRKHSSVLVTCTRECAFRARPLCRVAQSQRLFFCRSDSPAAEFDDDKRFIHVANCSFFPFSSPVPGFCVRNGCIIQLLQPFLCCCYVLRHNVADEISLLYPGEEHDAV